MADPAPTINTQDIVTSLDSGTRVLSQLAQIIQGVFPRAFGTFTMSATSSKVVSDSSVKPSSIVLLMETNASAATLQGSAKRMYISVSSGSFTVATANAVAAAGTENFAYSVFTPS